MGFVTNKWQPVSIPGPTPVVPVRYGVKFKNSGLTANTQLTYVFDAVGMTSATLDTNGFSWGSWENTVLGKSFYPAVTTDRNLVTSIDYKLNPNDYTKKTDGTEANITSTSGNVVSVFEGGWISIYNQQDSGTNYTYVVWSNIQYDSSYQAFHRLQSGNVLHNGFTVGCYFSSSNSLTATPSLSGSTATSIRGPSLSVTTNTLITYYQMQYIHYLSMIMFCNIDMFLSAYTDITQQGSQNDKGLFNITADNTSNKLFGIENFMFRNLSRYSLLSGYSVSVPRITSRTTSTTATHRIYDYSTDTWVSVFQGGVNKASSVLSGYFCNVYAPTFNPNATGYYYTSFSVSNYGLFPNSLTRTSNPADLFIHSVVINTSTSGAVTKYTIGFDAFTRLWLNSQTTINFNLRYASFID